MALYVRSGGTYRPVNYDGLFDRWQGVYYKQRELYVKDAGQYKLAWRADTPPPPPTNLTAVAMNDASGTIHVEWAWQPNYEYDYLRVEVQEPGDIRRYPSAFPETSQNRSGYVHGQSVTLQARTVDQGGNVSPWVQFGPVSVLSVPPGPPGAPFLYWNGSTLMAEWDNPGNPHGDIYKQELMVETSYYGTDQWTVMYSGPFVPGHQGPVSAFMAWDKLHRAKVRLYGGVSQTYIWEQWTDSQPATWWTPPAPGTTKEVGSAGGDTFIHRPTFGSVYHFDGKVRQGVYWAPEADPSGQGEAVGIWVYGIGPHNAASALPEACNCRESNWGYGYPPISGEVFMMRDGANGAPGNLSFYAHGYRFLPGGLPLPPGNGITWASTNTYATPGATAWEPLPRAFLDTIANGTTQGLGIYTSNRDPSAHRQMLSSQIDGQAARILLHW
jgi:hypothetical protein